jgi:multidrug resistance efflux pump
MVTGQVRIAARSRAELERAQIRAPFAGRVLDLLVQPG